MRRVLYSYQYFKVCKSSPCWAKMAVNGQGTYLKINAFWLELVRAGRLTTKLNNEKCQASRFFTKITKFLPTFISSVKIKVMFIYMYVNYVKKLSTEQKSQNSYQNSSQKSSIYFCSKNWALERT